MSWIDRLREAAYTSPSGDRLTFSYEDVGLQIDKRTAAYEFPDADGTLVQDLGHSGRRFPLRVIFHGGEYDTEATAFESALLERGPGILEHPIYGTVDVVPFGAITRNDALKTAANQAIFEVQFWSTIGVEFPAGQVDPAAEVAAAVEAYNVAAAEQFEDNTETQTATEAARFKGAMQAVQERTENALQQIADVQRDVARQFSAISESINSAIDTLISDPLSLAFQTIQLVQAPGRAAADIRARLEAYANLAADIFTRPAATPDTAVEFFSAELSASTYVTGSVVSSINTEFDNKTTALEAADSIIQQFEAAVEWREDNYNSAGRVDTGEAHQALQRAVAVVSGFLVQISFDLAQEYRVILDRDRQLVELAADLYGEVDERLDQIINNNALTGSEILVIPKGREIVYYI
jgi:prophage DNA circulation protein